MLKSVLFYTFLIISTLAIGQSPLRLSFQHLTREEGLSNSNVFSMYKDSRGYLWLSTMNGLNRFDGINCKVYSFENSNLKGSKINTVLEDKKGNLWVGSDAGLNLYDRAKDEFSLIQSPSKENNFEAYPYSIDDKNLLWLIIDDKQKSGLYTYNISSKKYSFITNQISNQVPNKQQPLYQKINTIYCGGKDDLGIRKLSFEDNVLKTTTIFFDGESGILPLKNVKNYLFLENDSTLWITNNHLGLIKFNPQRKTYKSYNTFENKKIGGFTQTVSFKGNLLVGSIDGLYVFDKKTEKFIQVIRHNILKTSSLQSNYNEILYIDNLDNFFISPLGSGIDYANLNQVLVENWLSKEDGYSINDVEKIFKKGDKTLVKFQGENGTTILDDKGKVSKILKNNITLFVDSENRIWTTNNNHFYILDANEKVQKEINIPELKGQANWQISIVEIEKGIYVIASNNGFFEYHEKTSKLIPISGINRDKTTYNFPVFYDKTSKQLFFSANWWTTFYVLKKQNDEWKINFKNDLVAYAIRPSKDSNKIWLGTNKGLLNFDKKSFKYKLLTKKEGLPDNVVTDILEENNENHWLVTNRGISYFDAKQHLYKNLSSKQGVSANEIAWNSSFNLSNGRSVFARTNGIFVLTKAIFKREKANFSVQIQRFLINDKPLNIDFGTTKPQKIDLEPTDNSFSIDLAAIGFDSPQKLKIFYQLEGYDKHWIDAHNPATARYSQLTEGNYTFKIKAIDEDQNRSSDIKIINITLQAPFYRTTWFRLLCVLFILVIIYLYSKFREKQIREFTEKTLLKAKNQEIQHTLDLLKSTQDKLIQSEKLASLGELTAGIAHEIQNPLNFVNNFSDIGIDLTNELKEEIEKPELDKEYIVGILTDLSQNQTKINHHGKRASNIIKGMLEHSHASRGEKTTTNINKLIEDTLNLVLKGYKLKNQDFNVQIIKDFDEKLPEIEIISQNISRVLQNLLNNAFYSVSKKYGTESVGKVVISTKMLSDDQHFGKCELRVTDNGTGILENIKQKIFQPFFTTKPTGEGTGLGLSLAYDIITKGHGGTIEAESIEGEGATFIVKL